MTAKTVRLTRQDLKESTRACSQCGAKLSSYNDNDTCFAHTVELPWKGPSTRPK
ncbi:MAG: hypothetical protein JWO22_4029 [Frankiales bacterium]|nr:hypothetical protein [Frankiales bacterium]